MCIFPHTVLCKSIDSSKKARTPHKVPSKRKHLSKSKQCSKCSVRSTVSQLCETSQRHKTILLNGKSAIITLDGLSSHTIIKTRPCEMINFFLLLRPLELRRIRRRRGPRAGPPLSSAQISGQLKSTKASTKYDAICVLTFLLIPGTLVGSSVAAGAPVGCCGGGCTV